MKLEKWIEDEQFDPTKLVTSHEIFSKKTISPTDGVSEDQIQKKFADDSLFSKRIFGDMDAKEEYSCECGKFHGKFFSEKTICDKCGKPVEFVGLNINRCGWIDLSLSKYNEDGTVAEVGNGFHIIKYIAYMQLEKIIGADNLRNIIHAYSTITLVGDRDTAALEAIRSSSDAAKYYHVGLEEFYDKYEEILDYYYELRKKGNNKDNETYNRYYNYLKK